MTAAVPFSNWGRMFMSFFRKIRKFQAIFYEYAKISPDFITF